MIDKLVGEAIELRSSGSPCSAVDPHCKEGLTRETLVKSRPSDTTTHSEQEGHRPPWYLVVYGFANTGTVGHVVVS